MFGARFAHWRVRVAFPELLAFIFGFSREFFSGLKKKHEKRLKIFDRKSISKFWSKIFRTFLKNRDFGRNFSKKSKNPIFFIENGIAKFSDFSIFRRKSRFFKILRKTSGKFSIKNLKSIFDQKFSILFHDFFFKPL